ncbi:aspartate beta-hydroxylase domain-containing protein 2 [Octopus sinensis]|uniref:Aspartate beta-hydroxylase domain-containing protein 2 n=1 Tax=Octopus sinensis TaxID=2607531 RepID=A0A6P7SZ69_9MOLL|nr:aspartate beta-hydroxylase domain-containing protein 2 [Octopus sinensis]
MAPMVELAMNGWVLLVVILATYCLYRHLQKTWRVREKHNCSSLQCNCKLSVLRAARRQLTLHILKQGNNGLSRIQNSLSTQFHYLAPGQVHISNKYVRNPTVFRLEKIQSRPWWYGDQTAATEDCNHLKSFQNDLKILSQNFEEISEEFFQVWPDDSKVPGRWKVNNTDEGRWCVFHFLDQGQWIIKNTAFCPRTTTILKSLPNLMADTMFGHISFSIMYPGTKTSERFGVTNTKIRCHMGIVVPNNCSLTVSKETHSWKTGHCLLFDDSYLHTAAHYGHKEDNIRAVLMLDFWHPDITSEERTAMKYIFPSVNQ